ncbi:MAG: glycosyltransferase family 4 protein [Ilumatobacteraceae bacterium]
MTASRRLRLIVLCPHFAPDIAPTGVVMTRIIDELAKRGHELHVITAAPWYREHRVERGFETRWWRVERTEWGTISRVNPFPGKSKSNILRRAIGFVLFSLLVGVRGLLAGGRGRVDGVLAMSPPLTLGVTGWLVRAVRGGRLVFNIQDVFPDAAIETGAITNPLVVSVARWLEKFSYRRSDDVVALSEDLAANMRAKLGPRDGHRVRVIPNFVDTVAIAPVSRNNSYRADLGIGDEPVVMYAGNVGYSQSLELMIEAARAIPAAQFVINGDGSARESLEERARGLANVRFVDYQPIERLPEVLAAADVHVVPLRKGLARVSVPSKSYSVLSAGRALLAAIDPGTEIPRLLADSGGGIAVAPDDPTAFIAALREMLADPERLSAMGRGGRAWVERHVSPSGVAVAYESLFLSSRHG